MDKRQRHKEIFKLTTKEILFTFLDLAVPFFKASFIYRQPMKKYLKKRSMDRERFFDRIQYLKRQGYIQEFIEAKKKFLRLTLKGKKRAERLFINSIKIEKQYNWDGKWRIVIFDVSEKFRHRRDIFRSALKSMGFIPIQKSVYVYPYDCANEIAALTGLLCINKFVIIMISDIIQGEEKIIDQFLDKDVLLQSDLKQYKNKKMRK